MSEISNAQVQPQVTFTASTIEILYATHPAILWRSENFDPSTDLRGADCVAIIDQPSVSNHRSIDLSVPVNTADHSLGPARAPVTVVEYGDFECPNCKQAAPAVKLLFERFPERVRFVYRHFPLEEVHPHAFMAAEAAECAGAQGKFWAMHDLLFDSQLHLKAANLLSYAARLSIDMSRYAAEMNDHVYVPRIREHLASGNASGVRGTPTFYVDGRIADVSFGLRNLFDAVGARLQR